MNGTVNIQEFVSFLNSYNLIIVNKDEYLNKIEADLLRNQKKVMKQDFIKATDLIKYKLLKTKSRQSFHNWIKNNTIKENEYEKDVNNRNALMLSNICVLRLQKEKL